MDISLVLGKNEWCDLKNCSQHDDAAFSLLTTNVHNSLPVTSDTIPFLPPTWDRDCVVHIHGSCMGLLSGAQWYGWIQGRKMAIRKPHTWVHCRMRLRWTSSSQFNDGAQRASCVFFCSHFCIFLYMPKPFTFCSHLYKSWPGKYIDWCVYSSGKLFMHSQEGHFGVNFPSCEATPKLHSLLQPMLWHIGLCCGSVV